VLLVGIGALICTGQFPVIARDLQKFPPTY